jgi:hypothetical protein
MSLGILIKHVLIMQSRRLTASRFSEKPEHGKHRSDLKNECLVRWAGTQGDKRIDSFVFD